MEGKKWIEKLPSSHSMENRCVLFNTLLNSLEMKEKGYDVKLIIEGTATLQVKELLDPNKSFSNLFEVFSSRLSFARRWIKKFLGNNFNLLGS